MHMYMGWCQIGSLSTGGLRSILTTTHPTKWMTLMSDMSASDLSEAIRDVAGPTGIGGPARPWTLVNATCKPYIDKNTNDLADLGAQNPPTLLCRDAGRVDLVLCCTL